MTEHVAETVSYYRLEVVARLAGLTPGRVRRLEEAGLLEPVQVCGRVRLYSEREVARLRKIRRLTRDLGINLAGVAVILRLTEELEDLRRRDARRSEASRE